MLTKALIISLEDPPSFLSATFLYGILTSQGKPEQRIDSKITLHEGPRKALEWLIKKREASGHTQRSSKTGHTAMSRRINLFSFQGAELRQMGRKLFQRKEYYKTGLISGIFFLSQILKLKIFSLSSTPKTSNKCFLNILGKNYEWYEIFKNGQELLRVRDFALLAAEHAILL